MAKRNASEDDDHTDHNKIKSLIDQFQEERLAYLRMESQLKMLCKEAEKTGDQKVDAEIRNLWTAKEDQLARGTFAFKAAQEELYKAAAAASRKKRRCLDNDANSPN